MPCTFSVCSPYQHGRGKVEAISSSFQHPTEVLSYPGMPLSFFLSWGGRMPDVLWEGILAASTNLRGVRGPGHFHGWNSQHVNNLRTAKAGSAKLKYIFLNACISQITFIYNQHKTSFGNNVNSLKLRPFRIWNPGLKRPLLFPLQPGHSRTLRSSAHCCHVVGKKEELATWVSAHMEE